MRIALDLSVDHGTLFEIVVKPFDDPRVRKGLTLGVDRWGGSKYLQNIAIVKTAAGIGNLIPACNGATGGSFGKSSATAACRHNPQAKHEKTSNALAVMVILAIGCLLLFFFLIFHGLLVRRLLAAE